MAEDEKLLESWQSEFDSIGQKRISPCTASQVVIMGLRMVEVVDIE